MMIDQSCVLQDWLQYQLVGVIYRSEPLARVVWTVQT